MKQFLNLFFFWILLSMVWAIQVEPTYGECFSKLVLNDKVHYVHQAIIKEQLTKKQILWAKFLIIPKPEF